MIKLRSASSATVHQAALAAGALLRPGHPGGGVVRYLVAEAGVRQFLDLGSGLPAADNVHEVAQAIDPVPFAACVR